MSKYSSIPLSLLLTVQLFAQTTPEICPDYVTPAATILEKIRPFRASSGYILPREFAETIGVTHVAGKYHLTDRPFLVEGAQAIHELGFQAAKFWLNPRQLKESYPYNSDWSSLREDSTFVALASHPYYQEAFALPFQTIALEISPVRTNGSENEFWESDFAEDEKQIGALADYLFATYRQRKVTFILQNWEGDWMLRSNAKEAWKKGEYPDLAKRVAALTRWFNAIHRAVSGARDRHAGAECQVLHAVEVNLVPESWQGIPTVTNQVLPNVSADLISWSCYSGLQSYRKSGDVSAVGLWQGIETIRHFARKPGGEMPVMIGEIGLPERRGKFTTEEVESIYDGALAALVAQHVSWTFLWEIYCNEPLKEAPPGLPTYPADQLSGFWLRRPDGSMSASGNLFQARLRQSFSRTE